MKTACMHLRTGAFIALLASSAVAAVPPSPPILAPTWKTTPGNPTYYINAVSISGAGDRVVAGTFFHSYGDALAEAAAPTGNSGTFGTYCYSQTGTLLWKDEFTAWEGVYWVDISTDGKWAAAGGWMTQSPATGFVRAYDATSGKTLATFSTSARVNQVSLSADGTWLVSAADTLRLFQRTGSTYKQVDEFRASTTKDTMETIALSADGMTLVAADYAGKVMLFSLAGGKFGTPASFALPGGGYSHSVRITPDGKSFAAGGSKGNVHLFDSATFRTTGQPSVTYTIPNAGSIYGVAIAADGSAFVGIANTSGSKGTVYYVKRTGSTGTLAWTFPTLHNPNSASLNSSKNLLAVADGHPDGTPGAFYLLDSTSGTLLGQCATGNMSWPIMIAAGGSAVIGGSDDGNIYYFVASALQQKATSPHGPKK